MRPQKWSPSRRPPAAGARHRPRRRLLRTRRSRSATSGSRAATLKLQSAERRRLAHGDQTRSSSRRMPTRTAPTPTRRATDRAQHRQEPADRSGRRAGAHRGRHARRAERAPRRVRLVDQGVGGRRSRRRPRTASAASNDADASAEPVGESHFASPTPMTVERGSSSDGVDGASGPTDGEVVYLYDAESERGNDHFAFRAVRFRNPTDSTLETGPGHGLRQRALHRRGADRAHPAQGVGGRAVRARSADRRRAQGWRGPITSRSS